MHLSNEVKVAITVINGLCWIMVYLLIIYRSVKDKTYGMPFWALTFNISWEFIFSFVFVENVDPVQLIIFRIWFGLDVFILIAYFAYGMKEWPMHLRRIFFTHILFLDL